MVLLNKSLYGHPESGAHWERHLTKAVTDIGGEPVPGHLSTFFFPKWRILLTVYVDDLLASGPTPNLAAFWALIGGKVDIGDPEPLNRFLGRNHHILPLSNPGARS